MGHLAARASVDEYQFLRTDVDAIEPVRPPGEGHDALEEGRLVGWVGHKEPSNGLRSSSYAPKTLPASRHLLASFEDPSTVRICQCVHILTSTLQDFKNTSRVGAKQPRAPS